MLPNAKNKMNDTQRVDEKERAFESKCCHNAAVIFENAKHVFELAQIPRMHSSVNGIWTETQKLGFEFCWMHTRYG